MLGAWQFSVSSFWRHISCIEVVLEVEHLVCSRDVYQAVLMQMVARILALSLFTVAFKWAVILFYGWSAAVSIFLGLSILSYSTPPNQAFVEDNNKSCANTMRFSSRRTTMMRSQTSSKRSKSRPQTVLNQSIAHPSRLHTDEVKDRCATQTKELDDWSYHMKRWMVLAYVPINVRSLCPLQRASSHGQATDWMSLCVVHISGLTELLFSFVLLYSVSVPLSPPPPLRCVYKYTVVTGSQTPIAM